MICLFVCMFVCLFVCLFNCTRTTFTINFLLIIKLMLSNNYMIKTKQLRKEGDVILLEFVLIGMIVSMCQ